MVAKMHDAQVMLGNGPPIFTVRDTGRGMGCHRMMAVDATG